jgi:hypothetical protein
MTINNPVKTLKYELDVLLVVLTVTVVVVVTLVLLVLLEGELELTAVTFVVV